MPASEIERPDESWKYPYMAAVIDYGSTITINVTKSDDMATGYRIWPSISIASRSGTAIGFLDDFCERHDVSIKHYTREHEGRERYEIRATRRDSVQRLLTLVMPYLIARYEPAELIVTELIPRLNRGEHSEQEGFVEIMSVVDSIREYSITRSDPKYSEAYFRDLWDMPDR